MRREQLTLTLLGAVARVSSARQASLCSLLLVVYRQNVQVDKICMSVDLGGDLRTAWHHGCIAPHGMTGVAVIRERDPKLREEGVDTCFH